MGCDGIWEKLKNSDICDYIEERINKNLDINTIL